MKAAVIYYSKSGHTRRVAEQIAKALGAELDEVRERRKRGLLKIIVDGIRSRTPEIDAPELSMDSVDLIVLGTPVWGSRPAQAIEVFLSKARFSNKPIALFCTMGGTGDAKTFQWIESRLSDNRVVGHLSFSRPQLRDAQAVAERISVWTEDLASKVHDS